MQFVGGIIIFLQSSLLSGILTMCVACIIISGHDVFAFQIHHSISAFASLTFFLSHVILSIIKTTTYDWIPVDLTENTDND